MNIILCKRRNVIKRRILFYLKQESIGKRGGTNKILKDRPPFLLNFIEVTMLHNGLSAGTWQFKRLHIHVLVITCNVCSYKGYLRACNNSHNHWTRWNWTLRPNMYIDSKKHQSRKEIYLITQVSTQYCYCTSGREPKASKNAAH